MRADLVSAALLLGLGVTRSTWSGPPAPPSPPRAAAAGAIAAGSGAILFDDLGSHHHPVTTSSPLAQRYFDQGLTLTYAFNHEEAIRSFQEAARLDPGCAMAYWGIALAYGPNINRPMPDEAVPEALRAIREARQRAAHVTSRERAYIEALAVRYAPAPAERRESLDLAYAGAMRELSERYPDDLDAATLFASALMNVRPWRWWRDGRPTPEAEEAITVLEAVLDREASHIGANHYHVHALETGTEPARALPSADRLRDLVPGAGHLLHMPSHIYLRVGLYHDASIANERAIAADLAYIDRRGYESYYVQQYYPHNVDWLVFATMTEGRSEASLAAAREIAAEIDRGKIEAEHLRALPLFVRVRFGRWDEILATPRPPERASHATLVWRYARGMAHAAKGDVAAAERDAEAVGALASDDADRRIARALLDAAIARAEGRRDESASRLEEAVAREESRQRTPLPRWYYPIRQYLGAVLLEAGRPAEAEAVYRRDLEEHPANGWSLWGLAQSLRAQGRDAAAAEVQRMFDLAWIRADVDLADSSAPKLDGRRSRGGDGVGSALPRGAPDD